MDKAEIIAVFQAMRDEIDPMGENPFVKTTWTKMARFVEALIALAEKLPDEPSGGNQGVYWAPEMPEYDDH